MGVDAIIQVAVPPDDSKEFEKKLRRWNYEFGGAFYAGQEHSPFQWPALTRLKKDEQFYALEPRPPKGFVILELHVWTRYYGKGYERGNLFAIVSALQWLSERIPSAHGHRPYFGGFDRLSSSGAKRPLCPDCQEPAASCGGGGDKEFWNCLGCPWRAVGWRDGTLVPMEKGQDFFQVAHP